MSTPHSHIPYGEEGSGFYSANILGCFHVQDAAKSIVLKALDEVPVAEDSRVFTIGDYGTADGGVSMPLITDMIGQLRSKYGDGLHINVIYEDQPVNDFKSVFLKVHGLEEGTSTYMKKFKNVHVLASGTGFFETILPPDTLDFGFCFTAMHWLSNRPCTITDAIHMTSITVENERRAFREQAAKDWEMILLSRAQEMKTGARFFIANLGLSSEGYFLGSTPTSPKSMYATMTNVLKDMVKDKIITQDEFNDITINNYYRTKEELKAPFNDPNSMVSKAGLKLISLEEKVTRCPYHAHFVARTKAGDDPEEAKKIYISRYLNNIRPWCNSTLTSGLSEDRSAKVRQDVVDKFFEKLGEVVALEPEKHSMDQVHQFIIIYKQ